MNEHTPRLLRKHDSIRILKNAGLEIAAVIDIGVQDDTWELRLAFPDLPHALFEPVKEYHQSIRGNYEGMDYRLHEVALSDRSGVLQFKDIRADDAGVVSHVRPAGYHEDDGLRTVAAVTLDDFLFEHQVPKPYLIKIDVDGHETEVMRGAKSVMKDANCLIVESTMPNVTERCMLAEKAGLVLWDIVDFSYYRENLYQVDLIFIAESAIKAFGALDPYKSINQGFEASKWYSREE
jgi:FkbM family methyltransferase